MNSPKTVKNTLRKKKKSNPTAGGNNSNAVPLEVPSQDRGGGSGLGTAPRRERGEGVDDEWKQSLDYLVEAFSLLSIEEVCDAFRAAEGDAGRAAEILGGRGERNEAVCGTGKRKKKVVAATGLVSHVIGKEYMWGNMKRVRSGREMAELEVGKGHVEGCRKEEAEQFLFELIGDSCELGYGVIRDVFGNCGYDVEMTLDTLFDMLASSNKQHNHSDYVSYISNKEKYLSISQKSSFDGYGINMRDWKLKDYSSDSKYQPHENVDGLLSPALNDSRQHIKFHGSSFGHPSSLSETKKLELPQKVLESFFNITDISKYESNCMNWKSVVKKLEAFGEGFELNSAGDTKGTLQQPQNGTSRIYDDSYHSLRSDAKQHWDTMKSYYQRAASAYAKGEGAAAACLSDQGKYYHKLAREADEKASRDIFEAKNKNIENVITIDLHGQHVHQAMMLLKLHVLMLTYSPAIQILKVITGTGRHSAGNGKLKQSAIDFLTKEGIRWYEENSGTLVVKVDRFKEYSFVKSDGDLE